MVIEICAGIATLVFIVLAIFAIRTLMTLQCTLKKINVQIDPLADETFNILKNTTAMTDSLQDKLEAFDPLFDSISEIGGAIKQKSEKEKKPWQETAASIIVLAAAGIKVWQEIKKGEIK